MRAWMWSAAAVAVLAVTAPVGAQTAGFGGVDPTKIQLKPITVPDAISQRPIAQPQNLQPFLQTRRRLVDYLPRISFPVNAPVHGQSIFPTPQNMPGKNYLKAFGYQRPPGIEP